MAAIPVRALARQTILSRGVLASTAPGRSRQLPHVASHRKMDDSLVAVAAAVGKVGALA